MESIADLAFLSDSRTAAIVDRTGTVSWYCPLRFDAPSAFASLLDPSAGHWLIRPASADARAERAYLGDSLILRTTWHASEGEVTVTDFLALEPGKDGHDLGRRVPAALVRMVDGVRGTVPVRVDFAPRFEYGLTVPRIDVVGRSARMRAGPLALRLTSDIPLAIEEDSLGGSFALSRGDKVAFVVTAWDAHAPRAPKAHDAEDLLQQTRRAWASWMAQHTRYKGVASGLVVRSALVLQGLTDARTGAVIAAATTSLPEVIGGEANWDYRYSWLRDLSFVMRALWIAACPEEADRFLKFLAHSLGRLEDRRIQIMLGSDGRRDLTEHTLDHLRGYRDSRPVRIGNDAWGQLQLDVMGEVLDSAHLLREQIDGFDTGTAEFLIDLAERAARDWDKPDAGMWEARDEERPYTSSKIMCWVSLDRAIALGKLLKATPRSVDRWTDQREAVRQAILDKAWSTRAEAFTGAFGSDQLDASVLLMPLVDFLPADDPRMAKTINAIDERLTSGALVHRWDGDQNGFLLCSFWLVECLWLMGRRAVARKRFAALGRMANDVGLLAEMAEPGTGAPIGNFPQAFSHIGLINAAWRLTAR